MRKNTKDEREFERQIKTGNLPKKGLMKETSEM